MHSKHDSNKLQ